MNVIKNEICIGIDKPFTILQMTDTHLVHVGESVSAERQAFAQSRKGISTDEDLDFAREYVAQTGYPLIHTGDLLDFLTPESLEISRQFAKDTNMLMVAGNHEQCYCPGNVFCETDYAEELKVRERTLDELQTWFDNDVRFFCKEINGVCLVGLDDGDYQITQAQMDALEQVVKTGKPILLSVHIPLYSDEIYAVYRDCMVGTPEERMGDYTPWQLYEQTANPTTRKAYAYIVSQPQIKAVISGHMHFNFESSSPNGPRHLITGMHTMREITVK